MLSSSSFVNFVSHSSDKKLDGDNEDEDFKPQKPKQNVNGWRKIGGN